MKKVDENSELYDDEFYQDVINPKEFIYNFASEEFISKCVRVRPISGATGKDVGDGSEYQGKTGNMLNSIEDINLDEKTHRDAILDIDSQRRNIKEEKI